MSEAEAASTKADLDALRALQADASELERIERLLDRFNVFETIEFTRDELMHSRFLAFLLDHKKNDGLRDQFLKGVLRGFWVPFITPESEVFMAMLLPRSPNGSSHSGVTGLLRSWT
jgi:hypothetical protein